MLNRKMRFLSDNIRRDKEYTQPVKESKTASSSTYIYIIRVDLAGVGFYNDKFSLFPFLFIWLWREST